MKRLLNLGTVAILVLFSACTDTEELPKPQRSSTPTTTNNEITSEWKITSHTIEPVTSLPGERHETTNLYAKYDQCAQNSLLVFDPSGQYNIVPSMSFCVPSPSASGVWRYSANNTEIILDQGEDGQLFLIEELNERTLQLRNTVQEGGRNYYERRSYIRM